MNDRSLAAQSPTPERRDRAVAELCEHFAAGHIELDVLEHRLAVADEAQDEAELEALVKDLPALPDAARAGAVEERRPSWGLALALLGANSRKGEWSPPRRLNAVAVLGGVELDFRDARLAPGVTYVTAVALMGGIRIIVPAGLPVTVRGLGIMGGVDQMEQGSGEVSAAVPHLRVTALACMGGVEVKTEEGSGAEQLGPTRDEMRKRRRRRLGRSR